MSRNLKVGSGDSGGSSPAPYYRESSPGKIDVNSEESLLKWGEVLHMDRKELLCAVEEFGPIVRDIRRGLLGRENKEAA